MKQTIQQKYDLDSEYELVYVDYRDEITDDKQIEEIIQSGNLDKIEEDMEENYIMEARWQGLDYILAELEKTYGELPEDDRQEIMDYISEHDTSNPVKEIIENTPSRYFYYSLGLHIGEGASDEDLELSIKEIARRLRIKAKKHYEELKEVVINASYGGELVMLFEDKIEYLYDINQGQVIEFRNPHIAIIDRMNGSGWYSSIKTKIVCEFKRQNLHDDEGAPGYSFTGDVCGLSKGFMGDVIIRRPKKTDKIIKAMWQ